MKGLTQGQVFEVSFWLLFAIGAFAYTYSFNQDIEIYRYGAFGWPRAVILLIFLAAMFQFYEDVRFSKQLHEIHGITETDGDIDASEETEVPRTNHFRLAATLFVPVIYASLLELIGFYSLTPVFIAIFLYIAGERRWKRLIGVTVFIYVFILICFAKLLYVGLPTGNLHPFYDFSNWLLVIIR
ncbi:MAG: tripartite tricarboxylate transporter TctB family protein [Rhodospirillales bacterium]|nr:tripartite tricarboxylate transporter TctB family protein [Rhodospirillales bacterium]